MRNLIVAAVFSLSLLFTPSVSFADTFTIGAFQVVGFDLDKSVARDEARADLNDIVDLIDDALGDDEKIVSVITQVDWDGIAYSITFSVVIHEND